MYEDLFKSVSEELNIPEEVVKKAYYSFWEFIRTKIQDLPLKEDLSEEEFNELKTNFNIPSLGKLSCTYDRFLGVRERYKYIKKLKENDKDKES